jgi:hypothetical protein
MSGVIAFIPTLFVALAILIIGWVATKMITKLFVTFLRAIEFDKVSDKIGFSNLLKKGAMKEKPSTLMGCLLYWVFMVSVLILTVKALGLPVASGFLDKIFVYIPQVIVATLVLTIGMLVARVISTIVYITAKNTDMPVPETLRQLTKVAIVLYVAIVYLREIGFASIFEGANYPIFMTGLVFALSLAFGLAGKDIAARYLHILDKKD